jgi:hypothetical protein
MVLDAICWIVAIAFSADVTSIFPPAILFDPRPLPIRAINPEMGLGAAPPGAPPPGAPPGGAPPPIPGIPAAIYFEPRLELVFGALPPGGRMPRGSRALSKLGVANGLSHVSFFEVEGTSIGDLNPGFPSDEAPSVRLFDLAMLVPLAAVLDAIGVLSAMPTNALFGAQVNFLHHSSLFHWALPVFELAPGREPIPTPAPGRSQRSEKLLTLVRLFMAALFESEFHV